MLLNILYFIITFTICLIVFLVFSLLLVVVGVRIYEPVKGVCTCTTKLNGKTVLITGGNSGIGLETARDLAKRGARVIIASRNEQSSAEAVQAIVNSTGNPDVHSKRLDLASFDSIRQFAREFNETERRLDILVNNAGCAGVYGKRTRDGIDVVLQVNHFGPFLLTQLLLEKVKASAPSRIVVVSSLAHKFSRLDAEDLTGVRRPGRWYPYGNSKLLNVMWTRALAQRLPSNVTVNSLHPGVVQTDIFHAAPWPADRLLLWLVGLLHKTPREGAQTTVHLAVAPELQSASGGYYVDCRPAPVSSTARNELLVQKVWEKSCLVTST